MLKQRIITALILISIFVATLIYLPSNAFFFLTVFIICAAAWEWAGLMGLTKRWLRFFYLMIIVVLSFMAFFIDPLVQFSIAFVFWILAALQVVFYPRGSAWWGKSVIARGLMGLLVLTPCIVAVNFLRNQDNGIYVLNGISRLERDLDFTFILNFFSGFSQFIRLI